MGRLGPARAGRRRPARKRGSFGQFAAVLWRGDSRRAPSFPRGVFPPDGPSSLSLAPRPGPGLAPFPGALPPEGGRGAPVRRVSPEFHRRPCGLRGRLAAPRTWRFATPGRAFRETAACGRLSVSELLAPALSGQRRSPGGSRDGGSARTAGAGATPPPRGPMRYRARPIGRRCTEYKPTTRNVKRAQFSAAGDQKICSYLRVIRVRAAA